MTKNKDFASQMRHRIVFQNEVLTSDGGGGSSLSWVNVVTVWSAIDNLSGLNGRNITNEKNFAGQIQDKESLKFTIRYTSGLTAKMRIAFGSRVFNIRSIVNVNEKNEILQILAEEGVVS